MQLIAVLGMKKSSIMFLFDGVSLLYADIPTHPNPTFQTKHTMLIRFNLSSTTMGTYVAKVEGTQLPVTNRGGLTAIDVQSSSQCSF